MYPRSWSCKWGKTRFLLCLSDSQSNLFYHWDCHCPYFSRESVGLCFWLELEREKNWNWREEDKVDLQWKKCHMAINIRGLPHSSISKEAAFNLSQYQGLLQWVGSLHQVSKASPYVFFKICVHACSRSPVRLFASPWTVARQVPLSMESSRQENLSEFPCPPPGDLPDPGIQPGSPSLRADSLPDELSGMSSLTTA